MKKLMLSALTLGAVILLSGCIDLNLKPPVIKKSTDFNTYKYARIGNTKSKTGGVSTMFGSGYGYTNSYSGYNSSSYVSGASVNKSIDPSTMITGVLMQNGLVIDHSTDKPKQGTLIVSYGETGKRDIGMGAYTLGVVIQMVDAHTSELVYSCSAEGLGETEVDDIRDAIDRCLSGLNPTLK